MRLFIAVLIAFALCACTTALWSPRYAEEKISGFYVNPERNELLVAGRMHSYVFSIDNALKEILILSRNIDFQPYLNEFTVDKKNIIQGKLVFLVSAKKTENDQKKKLLALGFKETEVKGVLEFKTKIKGQLYDTLGTLPLQKLDKEYPVIIALPDEKIDIAKKIVATPLTITYDAVVTVPATFLLVLVMSTDSL